MKGFMTYFFEQHKRLVLGYSVVLLVAMIFAVSLKTTTVPAAVTILYVSIFASLATVASLNSDREIDQLLSLPGGRRGLVRAQYLNAVFAIGSSILAATIVTALTYVFTGGKAHMPSALVICYVISVAMTVVAIMQPLSMVFGKKGLLIGFAALMFIGFQTAVRFLLTNGGIFIFKLLKDYLVGHEIQGISVVISENMNMPDFFSVPSVLVTAGTAITLFVSSYIVARLVFSRKNFRVNKL